jgi:hypothetical protein
MPLGFVKRILTSCLCRVLDTSGACHVPYQGGVAAPRRANTLILELYVHLAYSL